MITGNKLEVGGMFTYTMASKDESMRFDFKGKYTKIVLHKQISYVLEDGRSVNISFEEKDSFVLLKESFEAEGTNADEMQRNGWKAILENFRIYTENLKEKSK